MTPGLVNRKVHRELTDGTARVAPGGRGTREPRGRLRGSRGTRVLCDLLLLRRRRHEFRRRARPPVRAAGRGSDAAERALAATRGPFDDVVTV
eukprot:scaffold136693_cov22-Tisochrysis_lutea.AAC.2